MDVSSGDYYRRLRLPRTASTKDIKAAFRRLARQYHPDLHPNRPDAVAKFQALREAYEVLSDRIRRQNYDERTAQPDYSSTSFSEPFAEPSTDTKEPYQRQHRPQSPTDFYIRGIRHALDHVYSAAIKDYSEAIALDPKFAEAYLRRAEVHYLLKNDSGVLADCQQAIALDPTEPKLYYYQGLARYRLGYVQSAIPAFSNAIARDAEDARYYNWRAIAAQDLGDIDEAGQDFRRAAQLYRSQGDIANYRDIQQTLKALGNAGRSRPYQVVSQLVAFVLRPFSFVFRNLFGRRQAARSSRFSRTKVVGNRSSNSASPNASSADSSFGNASPTQTRRSSPSSSAFQKPFKTSSRESSQEQVYWAPGVSSRPTVQENAPPRPMSGTMLALRLLSNPAGEMLPAYKQVPLGKRGVVGYALAVLANLCFVFGATQYFANSSWLLASCLWASGGMAFVAMVLALCIIRVWLLRIPGLWTADIFILGTTMVPLGLLTVAAGFIPALTQSLAAPIGNTVAATALLIAVFWALSQAAIALNNGLCHIHRFSGRKAAWLSPLILGLGIAAGVGTWCFFAASLFSVSVATVGV